MSITEHSRTIEILRSRAEVADFLRRVPNLPVWTRFFNRVGKMAGDWFRVSTLRGEGMTRISILQENSEEVRLRISTEFADIIETAELSVRETPRGSEVAFLLRLPTNLPSIAVQATLATLELELATLKDVLEASSSREYLQ